VIVLQAGGLVVRRAGDDYELLIVSSRRDPSAWVLPKGHIEAGETAEQAALREVREEAGVDGDLIAPLGDVTFTQYGRAVRVSFFLIRYRQDVASSDEGRRLRWCTYDEAMSLIPFEATRGIVREGRRFFPQI
jgi:8-oxo-dGTP pyrophosphatase MutT (NUDIX family)